MKFVSTQPPTGEPRIASVELPPASPASQRLRAAADADRQKDPDMAMDVGL